MRVVTAVPLPEEVCSGVCGCLAFEALPIAASASFFVPNPDAGNGRCFPGNNAGVFTPSTTAKHSACAILVWRAHDLNTQPELAPDS